MKHERNLRILWLAIFLTLTPGCATTQRTAFDLSGANVIPFADHAITVLIFISDDCPISNRYAPELNRLQESFASRGVGFWLVHADPTETSADILEHAQRFGLRAPELRDPKHHLARLARAKVTPTAVVFRHDKLVYHGRIDDRISDLGGKEHLEAGQRDLVEAVNDVLAGRPVRVAETRTVGCYIPELR